MIVKSARLPFADEKFSYLIAVKPGLAIARYQARVVARPVERKFETVFPLCTCFGARNERRVQAGSADARAFRKKKWGDVVD